MEGKETEQPVVAIMQGEGVEEHVTIMEQAVAVMEQPMTILDQRVISEEEVSKASWKVQSRLTSFFCAEKTFLFWNSNLHKTAIILVVDLVL